MVKPHRLYASTLQCISCFGGLTITKSVQKNDLMLIKNYNFHNLPIKNSSPNVPIIDLKLKLFSHRYIYTKSICTFDPRKKNRPWQDWNLQSPDPKSGALSIRPHGLSVRQRWKNVQTVQTRLCYFFSLVVLIFWLCTRKLD